MNESQQKLQDFVNRWVNNEKFPDWPPTKNFSEQSQEIRDQFTTLAEQKIRAHPTLSIVFCKQATQQQREKMIRVLSVGLWEKERRNALLPPPHPEAVRVALELGGIIERPAQDPNGQTVMTFYDPNPRKWGS